LSSAPALSTHECSLAALLAMNSSRKEGDLEKEINELLEEIGVLGDDQKENARDHNEEKQQAEKLLQEIQCCPLTDQKLLEEIGDRPSTAQAEQLLKELGGSQLSARLNKTSSLEDDVLNGPRNRSGPLQGLNLSIDGRPSTSQAERLLAEIGSPVVSGGDLLRDFGSRPCTAQAEQFLAQIGSPRPTQDEASAELEGWIPTSSSTAAQKDMMASIISNCSELCK